MKILFYCQHVLGVGHFFRALEICRALKDHEVVLVTGGAPVDAVLPKHVREIRLPPLMMDSGFKGLYSPKAGSTVEELKEERSRLFLTCVKEEAPDIFLVELYPFGRKAFRFELDPVLELMRDKSLAPCRVFCSLRDILVEKQDVIKYETRVVKTLNRFFDGVLVHSDPELLKLDETFSMLGDILIPVGYTGFVASKPDPGARERIRRELGLGDDEKIIVASAGGGSVGRELLMAVVQAFQTMNLETTRLKVFSGPFMDEKTFDFLSSFAGNGVEVERFTSDFLNLLSAADLSISMAGYNTCMNILAAGVPALVWPFGENREQKFRAERISGKYPLQILTDEDLVVERLAELIQDMLFSTMRYPMHDILLNGAGNTARLIQAATV